jgi:hypothetical protein
MLTGYVAELCGVFNGGGLTKNEFTNDLIRGQNKLIAQLERMYLPETN